jgi:hypothetical protein
VVGKGPEVLPPLLSAFSPITRVENYNSGRNRAFEYLPHPLAWCPFGILEIDTPDSEATGESCVSIPLHIPAAAGEVEFNLNTLSTGPLNSIRADITALVHLQPFDP